jgi:high-affinity Fe2+/Pb2+ permease
MSPKVVVGSAVACAAVIGLTAFIFELSLERAAVLAPVIVVAVGAGLAVVVLWTRVAVESLRRQRRPDD